jgi:Ca-activated chloride channel family protein
MSLTLAAPEALWWLAAVPLVWLALRFSRTNFNRRQKLLQAGVRSALLVLLAMALARPVISMPASRHAVVYVVDVSHSVASSAVESAAARIDLLNATLKPDHTRILAFASRVTSVPDTTALRRLASATAETDIVGRAGSDLELALSEARAELPPGDAARIILFSDGRQTAGDAHSAALTLAADGIPVFVEPMGTRDLGDAWVDTIYVPDPVPAGGAVTLNVVIGSQKVWPTATIRIVDGDRTVGTVASALQPGANDVAVEATFEGAGPHAVAAVLDVPDDPLPANNRLSREVVVKPPARVLYVEGTPASARYLRQALVQAGFDVTVSPPAETPATRDALQPWDVVILSDVARALIPDQTMTALTAWVEHDGGGLLVAGGEAVFGESTEGSANGYRRTELERLLPVTFERKDQPDVALVIVLDKSWSMNGRVMELCKAAAQAAVDALSDRQTVGILTFDDRYKWDVTPRNVGKHREEIRQAVSAIQPGGDTLIYPAVEQAYLALRQVKASAKHVVLLSDGRSYPDDYEGLVGKMVDAGMTVSSIAVGPSADAELLGNIAKWGKGRGYAVLDAKEVTQIFVKEARNAMSAFDEGDSIAPVVRARSVLSNVDLSDMPALRGRTAVVLKEAATEVLGTETDDPLLAFWPFGLGRTAVFASDVKDRWASAWLRWRGYGPFFSAVVRAVARQQPEPLALTVTPGVVREGTRTLALAIEARDQEGRYRDLLRPTINVQADGGSSATVTARQVAPGRYEASMIVDAAERLTVSTSDGSPSNTAVRRLLPDLDAEYRFRPPDDVLLGAIASATGGAVASNVAALEWPVESARSSRHALWPWLVAAALLLWMVDVLLRRIRVFEPVIAQS